ncbi:MAG: DUF502 domain-containing protein [Candidatus Desulfofervidaceae bacterium]|nr:DUF502 domain-containing protein [Candidatus Desulfofervidaceae bacterium]
MNKIKDIIKRNFLAGILVLVPISFTIYIVLLIFRTVDRLLNYLPPKYNPQTYIPFHVPGLGFVLAAILIFTAGFLARNYIGHKLIQFWENMVNRIPFIRGVYLAVKQLIETVFSKADKNFKQVVLVEYPRKGVYALAFTTGVTKGEVQEKTKKTVVNVFVPTTPNPTSGFYLLVPEEELIPLDMSVEDAFKLFISGGIVTPEIEKKQRKTFKP